MTTTIHPVIDAMARTIGSAYDGDADPNDTPNNWGRAMDATLSALRAAEEAGFVLVPVEPDELQLLAAADARTGGFSHMEAHAIRYRAMLHAHPKLTEDGR